MVDILRQFGGERFIVDSACDWGVWDPLGVPKTAQLALQSGISQRVVAKACYENALSAYGQSGQMNERDWINPLAIDQRTLLESNSILRGGREPRIDPPGQRRVNSLIIE